jgi:hypothetical protein
MTQLEYLNSEIVKADQALTAVPKDAPLSPAFARLRELKIARKVVLEMKAKKICSVI